MSVMGILSALVSPIFVHHNHIILISLVDVLHFDRSERAVCESLGYYRTYLRCGGFAQRTV